MPESFRSFIQGLISTKYGTAQAVADAIGMSLSAFSRGVRKEGTLSVENCLRLAAHAGEPPSRVLRLAGKEPIAELIEQLYGSERDPISGIERDVLQLWRSLHLDAQAPLSTLLHALAGARGHHHQPRQRRA
jgi:hypothetical protein